MSNIGTLTGTLTTRAQLSGALSGSSQISGSTNAVGGGTMDHARLRNRDVNAAHPIDAITGLETRLASIETAIVDGDATFVFQQGVASDTWTIEHGMGGYPSVAVVDSGGNTVYGDVRYLNESSIQIHFSGEFSGICYLN